MKYHSTFSTIVISLVVLLVFSAVALMVVSVLSMTSPTLIATNEILDGLSSADTPISVSFKSIDRNFRDGVFINGFAVGYEGEEIASFDRVTLHMGLFSLIRYVLLGTGELEIEAEGGSIAIPNMAGEAEGGSGSSFTLPQVLENYHFSISIHDTDAAIADIAKLKGIEASIDIDHGITGLSGNAVASDAEFNADGNSISASGISLSMAYEDGFAGTLSASSISAGYMDAEAEIGSAALKASVPADLDFQKAEAELMLGSVSIAYGDNSIQLDSADATYSPESIFLSLSGILMHGFGIDASIARAEASTEDLDSIDAELFDVLSRKEGMTLVDADRISMAFSISDRDISLSSAKADSAILSAGTDLFPVASFGNLEASADFSDETLTLSAYSDISLSSDSLEFSGTSLSLALSATIGNDGQLLKGRADLRDIRLPGIDESAEVSIAMDGEDIRINGNYGRYLSFLGSYDRTLQLSAMADSLPLYPLRPIISFFMPAVSEYIGENTEATGTVNINVHNGENGPSGPASLALRLRDIRFNDYAFDASTALSVHIDGDRVSIDNLSVDTDFATVSWSGAFNIPSRLPEGVFNLSANGKVIASALLELRDSREYTFALTLPDYPSIRFSGHVDFSESNLITSAAILSAGENIYPIDVTIDFDENTIELYNPELSINVEYGDGVYGSAVFSSFALPVPSSDIAPCVLNGTISASFVFSEQQLSLSVPSFQIENMRHLPTSPDLSFSAAGDNDGVRMENIIISGIETEPMRGSLELSIPDHSLVLYLSSSRSDKEEIRLSIYEENSTFSGVFRADNLNFARIGFDGLWGSINLTGSGSSFPTIAFTGSVEASSRTADMMGALSADLFVNSSEVVLSEILYEREGLRIASPSFTFSSTTGEVHTSASIEAARINNDRAYPVTTSFELDASFGRADNLFRSLSAFFGDEGIESASGHISIGETAIDNRLFISPRESDFSYAEGRISMSGSLLSGYCSLADRSFDISLVLDPVLNMDLIGNLTETGFEMKADIKNFEISVVNIFFPVPTVTFIDPAPAHGEIYIIKDGIEWNIYGKAEGETVAFDLFWMPDERVILHNPSFTIWENSITSLIDDCTVLDTVTYERSPGRVSLGVDLSQTLSLTQWSVDVYVDDGEEVGIRLPVQSANVDIWGDVSGHLSVVGYDNFVHLGGDIVADDLRMSVGMEPMPSWWATKKRTIMDMNLLLRSNISFVFPLGPNPMLTAMLAENQHLSVRIPESGGLEISGNLDIRSGEFFYFQKNFYITEGSISFPPVSYGGESTFNPNINLRARLRDFDSEGRPVDIYLVLRNSTLDNISPTFESSPNKNINEIMSILGGAILPTGVYGDVSVSSVFSLVSASVDILSRVGILRSSDNGLEASIRNALSLDTFSIHSNIVENILYDTVSFASSNLDSENVSPMARYLNGTTLYLGKYISPELYFEGMVHLQSSTDREDISHSFIADDLDLDIEISLEWNNPMCTVTFFTRPGNITVYDVMDTFGFEISKRIVW